MSNEATPKSLWLKPKVLPLLVIALLAEIGYATLNLSTMPVYLKADRHFGEGVIGLVLTAFLLSEALLKGTMGTLADRFGPRVMILIAPMITVFTSLVSLLIPHLGGQPIEVLGFVLLRALDGVALAMLWPAAFAQMNAICEDSERHQAMSLLNLCYLLGIALAFPLGGIVNDVTHTHYAGLILAILLLCGVGAGAFLYVEDKPTVKSENPESLGIQQFLDSARQIPEYLLLSLVTFAAVGFPSFIFKLFPIDEFGFTESQIGALIFPGAIAMAAISLPLTKVGESLGLSRAVQIGLLSCTVGMGLIGSGALLPFMRSPLVLAVGAIPIGIGFLLAVPAWMARVSEINPEKRATHIGAIMTAQGLGAIMGAPVGALMYEKFQPLGVQIGLGAGFGRYAPFFASAICVGLGWLLSVKVLHTLAPEGAPSLPKSADYLISTVSESSQIDLTEQTGESSNSDEVEAESSRIQNYDGKEG